MNDTIVAAATPPGESALAVIRVSGPLAEKIALTLSGGRPPLPRRTWLGSYLAGDGKMLDRPVCTFFPRPGSYTGEDVLEVSVHGNPLIVRRTLEDLCARGCRPAEPGEFTRRAFLHGKLDLTEAEAVMDLIRARSDRALDVAQRQLRGALGRQIETLAGRVLDLCAGIEAYIDFPDEDLPPEDRRAHHVASVALVSEIRRLAATRREGDLLRDGVRVVLLGEPNAGKSSLLNRLAGFERAIVSPEPGTTRDYLEEQILLGPHCIRLVDTAGLRDTPGLIEQAAVLRTLERTEAADLAILVVDGGRPSPALPAPVCERLGRGDAVIAVNKSDLGPTVFAGIEGLNLPAFAISALTGDGLEHFRSALITMLDRLTGYHDSDELVSVNARHARALLESAECLERAGRLLHDTAPPELVASELRGAMQALGAIVGRIDNEAMLDRLFASFCIGK